MFGVLRKREFKSHKFLIMMMIIVCVFEVIIIIILIIRLYDHNIIMNILCRRGQIKVQLFLHSFLIFNIFSILASQLRSDWSVTLDRLEQTYFVTWGAHVLPAATDAGKADGSVSTIGGPLPSYGRKLGKLEPNDFKQVIAKGIKTYGKVPKTFLYCVISQLLILQRFSTRQIKLLVNCTV